MGYSVTEKIIRKHLTSGQPIAGNEIGIRIDQTLTQDATGTMAYLQFEAMGIPRVKTELSVSYVDHNTLQTGFENADDHLFLQSIAAKHGIYFSRPGNGICHQVHLERFGKPGRTLVGSDSHTPTAGGLAMLAIGVGGLDVAEAMAGAPFFLKMPKIVNVKLTGTLAKGTGAKDIILELLRRLTVKGGVAKVFEYSGSGLGQLTVPERATITNMGAELGATSSVFPSDDQTRAWLKLQNRSADFQKLAADADARYDEVIEINLKKLEPLAACPHSPDNVKPVAKLAGTKVNQVLLGSCTNSSLKDLMTAVRILAGKKIHPDVSFAISPGSRQVMMMLSENGGLNELLKAGARILENACGPCIGMGFSPSTDGVSLRTFNRNFEGRSGTKSGQVYLVGIETACAAALTGVITDPRKLKTSAPVTLPKKMLVNDSMIIAPTKDGTKIRIIRGPNIAPLPLNQELKDNFIAEIILKVGDNITTDHIMPAGAKILPLRSNIPKISQHVYEAVDPKFYQRAVEVRNSGRAGLIVGGDNYGQGSSREHAALAPMYLGIRAVIAKSFARIHRDNLVNFGILPLTFADAADYQHLAAGEEYTFDHVLRSLTNGEVQMTARGAGPAGTGANQAVPGSSRTVVLKLSASDREKKILATGGKLNYIRTMNRS